MSLGGGEIMMILLVALIVFGPHRLPELSRQVGTAMRDFKRMQATVKREISDAINLDAPNLAGSSTASGDAPGVIPSYDNPDSYLPLDEGDRGEPELLPHEATAISGPDALPPSGSFS